MDTRPAARRAISRLWPALSALALTAGCVTAPEPAPPAPPPPAVQPLSILPPVLSPAQLKPRPVLREPLSAVQIEALLSHSARPPADRADDAARKPAEVLAFASIAPGDSVLELEAGRGWYSEIVSRIVGSEGLLIAHYPPEFTYGGPAFKERTDAGGLRNTRITVSHFDKLDVGDASVHRVLWFLGPHELYYTPKDSPGLGDVAATYREIARVLKPGGEFIAMDHAAEPGAPTTTGQTIHRIDPAHVIAAAEAAGLKLVGRSDILANPDDDRTAMVFNPTVRRRTDQFLFRFVKSAG